MRPRGTAAIVLLCFAVPVGVLTASWVWLAVEHGTPWLWPVVVHESGRYTLGQTVLYMEHFLREVPVVVAYALFLLGISGAVGRGMAWTGTGSGAEASAAVGPRPGGARARVPAGSVVPLAAAGLLVAGAFLASVRSGGVETALLDLLQYRTRDDLVGYGTHWRYHWLSTVWFGAAAGLVPVLVGRFGAGVAVRHHRGWTAGAWGYVLALTVIFGLSPDVFVDVRYAGHQAREILTHGPTTLLMGTGLVLVAARDRSRRRWVGPGGVDWAVGAALFAFLAIPLHLAAVSLSGDVMVQGQSELGLPAMVAAHYFEHTLDYLLTLLLLTGGLARARP